MDRPQTGKPGSPPYVPSEKDRRDVRMLAAMGNSVEDIAVFMEVTEPTLRKHFHIELHRGRIQGKITNGRRLHEAAQKGNVTAMIWIDKTRHGWRETDDMGKKEQVAEHARTAHQGTEWDGLLRPASVQ